MPPHMHPRSLTTASLFTTTLMVSFLVVAAPHLVPCPVDPRTLTDSADPTKRRRRRRPQDAEDAADALSEQQRIEERFNPKRECPIPKPGGLVGQVLAMGRGRKTEDVDDGRVTREVGRLRRREGGED